MMPYTIATYITNPDLDASLPFLRTNTQTLLALNITHRSEYPMQKQTQTQTRDQDMPFNLITKSMLLKSNLAKAQKIKPEQENRWLPRMMSDAL
jgi:hypothetical protein